MKLVSFSIAAMTVQHLIFNRIFCNHLIYKDILLLTKSVDPVNSLRTDEPQFPVPVVELPVIQLLPDKWEGIFLRSVISP